ncbi:MAG: nucleoside monophosphate kinase [bacterium]
MKNSNPLIIILLGYSGSGKGTQAEFLRKEFNLDYMDSGTLLRERKKKNDFTGRQIAKVIDAGGLLPTPIIFKLWLDKFEELKKDKDFKGFITGGSPRKIMEARLIDEALEWYGWNKKVKIFLIKVSPEEVITRLAKRRVCQKCGKIFVFASPADKIKECPVCAGKIIKRKDDSESGVKKRLVWFKTEVGQVIDYYRGAGRLTEIDGEQSIEEVFKDIFKKINGGN